MAITQLIKQEIQVDFYKKLVLTIDWCKSCGICMRLCPKDVLGEEEVTKKVILIAPEKCNGCGLCELSCPDYVFSIEELEDTLT